MPITFEEMVQTVINTVRDREQALHRAMTAEKRVKELEAEIIKLGEDHAKCSVREPDKKPTLQPLPLKEVKPDGK